MGLVRVCIETSVFGGCYDREFETVTADFFAAGYGLVSITTPAEVLKTAELEDED